MTISVNYRLLTAFANFSQNSLLSYLVNGANIRCELTEMVIVMNYVDTTFGVCEAKSLLARYRW